MSFTTEVTETTTCIRAKPLLIFWRSVIYVINSYCDFQGFFRRSIVRSQKNEDFEYRCVNDKKCILTGGKLRLCAHCRYQKCLAVGMSKGGKLSAV